MGNVPLIGNRSEVGLGARVEGNGHALGSIRNSIATTKRSAVSSMLSDGRDEFGPPAEWLAQHVMHVGRHLPFLRRFR